MSRWRRLAALAAIALGAGAAHGHGGGLDANGCHTDRKTGNYHCHRSPAAPAAPLGKRAAAVPAAPAAPSPPTCHVGPRGGTYTITPSGGKNYRGC